jgi:hypothetical protein
MKGWFLPRLLVWGWLGLVVVGCVDDTVGHSVPITGGEAGDVGSGEVEDLGGWPPPAVGVAVIGSDFSASSLSLLSLGSGALARGDVLHSGSVLPGLSMALSGDVDLPSAPLGRDRLVLIDRYPGAVLTVVSASSLEVERQIPVATGFASNPQDVLALPDGRWLVSRHETDPVPGDEPFDGGDDVLVVAPEEGLVEGRVPLAPYADAGLQARPGRMSWASGRAFVTLAHLDADFEAAGPGRLLALAPDSLEVIHSLDLPVGVNCGALAWAPAMDSLYLACSGLYADGAQAQLARSALIRVRLDGDRPEASVFRTAGADGDRPFGFGLDVLAGRWLVTTRVGDLATGLRDRVVVYDLLAPAAGARVVHEAASSSGIWGLAALPGADVLLISDSDPAEPAVHRYAISEDSVSALAPLRPHPGTGLPPRALRAY